MLQLNNIIRVEEGGVNAPYIVHERVSQFAQIQLPTGFKLIRETRGQEIYSLLCEPIPDAQWTDIPTEPEVEAEVESEKRESDGASPR